MNTRIAIIACFLLVFGIPAQAQWTQTSGPRNDIITYGGYVTCLASIGNDLFVGTQSSGLIHSTDNGSSWSLVNIVPFSSGDLDISFLLVNNGNFYAVAGGGLFLSIDNGVSWNQLPFEIPSFSSISVLTVSGGNLIVGTKEDSTYLSTDNGNNWTASDSPFGISSFATMGGNLYAGTSGGGGVLSGVFRSTDNGVSWTPTDTGQTPGQAIVFSIAANGGNLFASTHSGMFLSIDEGASWTAINSGLPDSVTYVSRFYGIAVSGQNLFAGTYGDGIYLSTNNGTSWSALPDNGLRSPYISSLLIDNGNIYAGTDGDGVFLSTDNGSDWTVHNSLTSINSHINSLDTIGKALFACTQGGLFATTDSGANWAIDSNGMGNLSINAVLSVGNDIFAATGSNGIFLSTNNGASWVASDSGITVGISINVLAQHSGILYATTDNGVYVSSNNGTSWYNPAFGIQRVDANAFVVMGKTFLAGSDGGIYYSPDSGKDWYASQDEPSFTNINSLAVIGGIVYAGTSGFGMWLSMDSGNSWLQANDSGLTDTSVTMLLVNDRNLFAATGTGRILFSSDGAATWHPVDSGLQSGLQITSLAIEDSTLYAGTSDSGIWRHSLLNKVSAPNDVMSPSVSEASLSVYPNPAMNSIAIASSVGPFSIFDPLGKSYQVKQMGNTLDISALPSGVYFVSDGVSRVKFVKE